MWEVWLRDFGFELTARADAGDSDEGAWFAKAPDGAKVVLKCFPEENVADRYAALLPALDMLRSRGVPAPEYTFVRAVEGWTLSAQRVLPGRPWEAAHGHGARIAPPSMVDRVFECASAAVGISGPPPAPSFSSWGEFVVHTLTIGEQGWAMHGPLRSWSARSAALLERLEAIGAATDASWFPASGLVHLDLHAGNLLADDSGTLTGIVDWDAACLGDPHFDLVEFAFDLDGAGQQIWDQVEPLIQQPAILRAYIAHLSLRFTDWAIRHHPEDVPRQLDRAERMLERYDA